jgi:23S rRNA pseudouridine2457 synthase
MDKHTTILFNKPDLVLSTFTDSEGRETLKNYVPIEGIYSAGRLDYDSEGLLVITNDGGLIKILTDPIHHQVKTYLAMVEGIPNTEQIQKLEKGIALKDFITLPCKAMIIEPPQISDRRKPITPHGPTFWIRVQIHEGKKHQIRQMTAAVGYPCLRLIRVAIGPIGIGDLLPGAWRELSKQEIDQLKKVKNRSVV